MWQDLYMSDGYSWFIYATAKEKIFFIVCQFASLLKMASTFVYFFAGFLYQYGNSMRQEKIRAKYATVVGK